MFQLSTEASGIYKLGNVTVDVGSGTVCCDTFHIQLNNDLGVAKTLSHGG